MQAGKLNVCRGWFGGLRWDIPEHAKILGGIMTSCTEESLKLSHWSTTYIDISLSFTDVRNFFRKSWDGDAGKKMPKARAQSLAVRDAVPHSPTHLLWHYRQVHSFVYGMRQKSYSLKPLKFHNYHSGWQFQSVKTKTWLKYNMELQAACSVCMCSSFPTALTIYCDPLQSKLCLEILWKWLPHSR